MRYLLAARIRPGQQGELLRALEEGFFGAGFPYGDLGEVLREGRVDASGNVRWIEVCYCREFLGVAMVEELPYIEEFLADITIADARSPLHCEGYPVCNDCDCTKKINLEGEPLIEFLRRAVAGPTEGTVAEGRPTRWLGWRGEVTADEARQNREGRPEA